MKPRILILVTLALSGCALKPHPAPKKAIAEINATVAEMDAAISDLVFDGTKFIRVPRQ